MSLCINGVKIKSLCKDCVPGEKIYFCGEIVFCKENPAADKKSYIEIKVDSSSGEFIVPLSCLQATGISSAIKIYANDTLVTEHTFTCDHTSGTGYALTGLTEPTTVIRIEPVGQAEVGWGRFFGFSFSNNGCNTAANKAKVLEIINDPDWAHLESDTYTGDNFRANQYARCVSLQAAPAEELPDTVTQIGDNFRYCQYAYCSNLLAAPAELLPDSITTIGTYFRAYQYRECNAITAAVAESIPNGVTMINDYFRAHQYTHCSRLIEAADEFLPDSVTAIGNHFRTYQYDNCYLMTVAGEEYLPNSVTTIGTNFRYSQYQYCSGLRTAPAELCPDSVTQIGDKFRYCQYFACRGLQEAPAEVLSANVKTIARYFRQAQYQYCSALKTAAAEYIPHGVTTIGFSFRNSQYQECTNLLTAAAESLPDTVTTIDDGFRTFQYLRCTSLTTAAAEVFSNNATQIGRVRGGQYENCSSLLIGSYIHTYHFPNLISNGGYSGMFSLNAENSMPDSVPRYYLDSTNTTTAPVTDLTPSFTGGYLRNRTGIANYANIAENWK